MLPAMKHIAAIALLGMFILSCGPQDNINFVTDNIIPAPQSIVAGDGTFKVAGAGISVSEDMDAMSVAAIEKFAGRLGKVTGRKSRVCTGLKEHGISFCTDSTMGRESYRIDITARSARITAADFHGVLYAIQTIGQMLPVEYYGDTAVRDALWKLPCLTIEDAPRYHYRGMHLDVARHFFSADEVKRYLDLMAMHKMNTFHWHLTDDQGWRVEIRKYPRLTEYGSIRKQTIVGHHNDPMHKVNGNIYDNTPYGGYYTQDEIRDVVAYADSLGITIIPEIDMPGHMVAALAAYPEMGCTGGPYEVRCTWAIADEALCPGKEVTFTFIEDVLTEIMELFPSEIIHIGGDECRKQFWENCPDCQRLIRKLGLRSDSRFTKEQYLQCYVTDRVQKFLADHGRTLMGWDEIIEGDISKDAVVMYWRPGRSRMPANDGFRTVMVPAPYFYFDYYQSEHTDLEPLSIGGFIPIEKTYSYEPEEEVDPEHIDRILGVQANLWTEFISDRVNLYYNLLPRMDALSEIQWCGKGKRDFERFRNALVHQMRVYDVLDYPYSRAVFGEYGIPEKFKQEMQ